MYSKLNYKQYSAFADVQPATWSAIFSILYEKVSRFDVVSCKFTSEIVEGKLSALVVVARELRWSAGHASAVTCTSLYCMSTKPGWLSTLNLEAPLGWWTEPYMTVKYGSNLQRWCGKTRVTCYARWVGLQDLHNRGDSFPLILHFKLPVTFLLQLRTGMKSISCKFYGLFMETCFCPKLEVYYEN